MTERPHQFSRWTGFGRKSNVYARGRCSSRNVSSTQRFHLEARRHFRHLRHARHGRHSNPMKIVDAKVVVCSPGRNFVTLKVTAEDGVYGLGDATLNGRELAVASYLTDHVIPLLVGRDARRIEDTWHYLYKGAYWRRGPVTMAAISAVDTALWDIRGKTLERARVSIARRRLARVRHGVRPRERRLDRRHRRSRGPLREDGLPRDSRTVGRARHAQCLRRRTRDDVLRAGREGLAARDEMGHVEVPPGRAQAVRAAAQGIRPRRAPAARRASPADAD